MIKYVLLQSIGFLILAIARHRFAFYNLVHSFKNLK